MILDHLGTAGYGVWVLGFTVILYLSIADAGFGPAVQRWSAIGHGSGDLGAPTRLLWTSVTTYAVIAIPAGVAVAVLAPTLAGLFVDPGPLRDEGSAMFRLIGLALVVVLLSNSLSNVLQGLGRFPAITVSSVLGSVTQLSAVLIVSSTRTSSRPRARSIALPPRSPSTQTPWLPAGGWLTQIRG